MGLWNDNEIITFMSAFVIKTTNMLLYHQRGNTSKLCMNNSKVMGFELYCRFRLL